MDELQHSHLGKMKPQTQKGKFLSKTPTSDHDGDKGGGGEDTSFNEEGLTPQQSFATTFCRRHNVQARNVESGV